LRKKKEQVQRPWSLLTEEIERRPLYLVESQCSLLITAVSGSLQRNLIILCSQVSGEKDK
jgi:hypothetical protein